MAKRLRNFRLGDRTEILAEMCLNILAFTTKVPRQEDIGHDFICFLALKEGGYLYAKEAFTVQVKSDKRKIIYKGKEKLQWIRSLENPLYFLVGNKKRMQIEIFSTCRILEEMSLRGRASSLTIFFNNKHGDKPHAYTKPENPGPNGEYDQFVHLGVPIIRVSVNELMEDEKDQRIVKLLQKWVRNDRANIVSDQLGLFWLNFPGNYSTNENPVFDITKAYYGPASDKTADVFFKSGTSLIYALENSRKVGSDEFEKDLKAFLSKHSKYK